MNNNRSESNDKPILYHNNEAYNDLAINSDIIKCLDKTITKIGRKKLHNRLKYCSSDVNHLENLALKNYTIHRDLVYRYDMEKYLTEIKELEESLDDWMLTYCNKNLVFNWNVLNNRYFLSVSNKMKFSTILIILVVYVLIYFYMNYHGFNISIKDYIKGIVNSYYQFLQLMCHLIMSNREWIEWIALVLTSLYVGYQLYTLYQSINASYEHYTLCNN